MLDTGVVVNFVHQNLHGFRIRELADAVSEIKDVAALPHRTEFIDQTASFGPNGRFTGKKHRRIHVALQRHLIPCTATGRREIDTPIDANAVRTARREVFEPIAATLGKNDDGYFLAVLFLFETADDIGNVFERKHLISTVGERTAPSIKICTAWAPASICALR